MMICSMSLLSANRLIGNCRIQQNINDSNADGSFSVPGPEVIKRFSYSTQLSMKYVLSKFQIINNYKFFLAKHN